MINRIFLYTIFISFYISLCSSRTSNSVLFEHKHCSYSEHSNSPEIYFINYDVGNEAKEVDHVNYLNESKLKYFVIDAISHHHTHIPKDLLAQPHTTTLFETCKYKTDETIMESNKHMKPSNKHYLLTGLCSREVPMSQLYRTMSHLLAIHRAVHSRSAVSRYALIMESGTFLPFDVDYDRLIHSAPNSAGEYYNCGYANTIVAFITVCNYHVYTYVRPLAAAFHWRCRERGAVDRVCG